MRFSPQRFDIIYLDFCGPLPSRDKKNKTLGAITNIVAHHALNSPGILVTNVALPSEEQDPEGRSLIARLTAGYLYPKSFLESGTKNRPPVEGAEVHGYCPETWLSEVDRGLDNYYGQFITRLLMDLITIISPYERFALANKPFSNLFKSSDHDLMQSFLTRLFHFDEELDGGEVISDAGENSILWSLASLSEPINLEDENYPRWIYEDANFKQFAELFLRQLSCRNNEKALSEDFVRVVFLLSEGAGQEQFWSERLKEMKEKHSIGKYYQFCDLVLFHQFIELFVRQLMSPYHVNVSATRRWQYSSKSTSMYMDMLVLDECRYLYDWMPNADMFEESMNDLQRQLIYRFALDAVSKHSRWFNSELLAGTAVVDQNEKLFEALYLQPRVSITNT